MLAARTLFAGEQSVNREFSSLASKHSGELALTNWRCCLKAGDSMAHFALGYTLYELGRYHEAYRQLRYYAQIAPRQRLELVLARQSSPGDRRDQRSAGCLRARL